MVWTIKMILYMKKPTNLHVQVGPPKAKVVWLKGGRSTLDLDRTLDIEISLLDYVREIVVGRQSQFKTSHWKWKTFKMTRVINKSIECPSFSFVYLFYCHKKNGVFNWDFITYFCAQEILMQDTQAFQTTCMFYYKNIYHITITIYKSSVIRQANN